MVGFALHILPVHLHYSVPWPQAGLVSRGAWLHFADELSAFIPLTVQVKAIAALPLGQETDPGSQLALHPSASKDGKQVKVSQENTQVFAPRTTESIWLLIQREAERFSDQKIIILQHARPLLIHNRSESTDHNL